MNLLPELLEIGHVGELARLFLVFSSTKHSIGSRELIELVNRTAGLNYRYPNAQPALELAIHLNLLRRAGNFISLTKNGELFVRAQSAAAELSFSQAQLLLALLMDHKDVREPVGAFLRTFGLDSTNRLVTAASSLDDSLLQISRILQQIGVVLYDSGLLTIDPAFESALPVTLIESSVGLSERELWKRLERQRLRALEAEVFALEQERGRLRKLGRPDLANLVFRVSELNSAAGYDIESFESDSSPRYIEVKSSTGYLIRFQWSSAERGRARKLGDRYWIYFVPLAYALPTESLAPVIMIRNPAALVNLKELAELPCNFLVEDPAATKFDEGRRATMISWPA